MKKILAGLVSAALALGCLALPAEVAEKLDSVITASAETYGDFEYTVLDDGTVEISDYNGSDTSITIPSSIKGKSVSTIGSFAFLDCTEIKSITIPDSVTSIEIGAFEDCANITAITIPDSVTTIETSAFRYCMRLKSITLPKNLTCIDAY
ncbi:MAG: leucine-rich repeat domain-containing protein, partial [Oscillospiraceae bacterium]